MELIIRALAVACVALPLGAALLVLLPSLRGDEPDERAVGRLAVGAMVLHALAAAALVALTWSTPHLVDLGQWYGDSEYALELSFLVDRAAALGLLLVSWGGLLSLAFSRAYLHQDPGHARFFVTSLVALACLDLVALAASLDLLFVGWESLGLCSYLLIAFFHEREETVQRGLRAITSYRVADLGLLFVLILLHRNGGSASFLAPPAAAGWLATATGLGLLMTAAGKAGLVPFSGWIARSTEGPTSSSAMFYGGLSVAAGPWLLLRAWPLYEASLAARVGLVAVGLLTALTAAAQARSRADVKGAVVMAGVAQTGLVVAEIGLGLHVLAALHLVGNVALRTWQLLQAPNVLHSRHRRDGLVGQLEPPPRRLAPQRWLLTRLGMLETAVQRVIQALMTLARGLDALSRRVEVVAIGGRDEADQ